MVFLKRLSKAEAFFLDHKFKNFRANICQRKTRLEPLTLGVREYRRAVCEISFLLRNSYFSEGRKCPDLFVHQLFVIFSDIKPK